MRGWLTPMLDQGIGGVILSKLQLILVRQIKVINREYDSGELMWRLT